MVPDRFALGFFTIRWKSDNSGAYLPAEAECKGSKCYIKSRAKKIRLLTGGHIRGLGLVYIHVKLRPLDRHAYLTLARLCGEMKNFINCWIREVTWVSHVRIIMNDAVESTCTMCGVNFVTRPFERGVRRADLTMHPPGFQRAR